MLRDREDLGPLRLAIPAGHARQAMGDVGDLDVDRRGVDQVEPPPRQHALPGARLSAIRSWSEIARQCLVVSRRQQLTR